MFDLIVIGCGVAGATAALYAARMKLSLLVVSKNLGGQAQETSEILNYPGIQKITGAQLSTVLEKQLASVGIKPVLGEQVLRIDRLRENFEVATEQGSYDCRAVIIATGARARKLNVPGEAEFLDHGVSYSALSDVPHYAGKDIAIVGGGNSALYAAGYAKDICSSISIINNRLDFSADPALVDGLARQKSVKVIPDANVTEILGDTHVTGIRYEKDGRLYDLSVAGVVIEAGRMPNTEFLKGFVMLDQQGHITVDCQARTSVEGVYAAGDCASGHEYHYIIAAGNGCLAALKAHHYLAGKGL